MFDAACTHPNAQKTYNILSFQKLPDTDIERYRQHLECPRCGGQAYYRKKSSDGKAACFGSRYHAENCKEGNSSVQREREVRHASEVNQIITDSNEVIFDFSINESKSSKEVEEHISRPKPIGSGTTRSHTGKKSQVRSTVLGMEKALNSLMRGSDLGEADTLIDIGQGYKYKAKNLFVNFADAEAADRLKDARPKMFWGTISHADVDMEWLNPSDCDDVGIPIKRYKDAIFKRFKVNEKRDLEGAGLMLFGKCFWNAQRTRKIIELWDEERVFISVLED